MAKKWRSAESYLGNTAEARKRQRANLIPGNAWDKRNRKKLKLDCWWEVMPLGDIQEIYEMYVNERAIKDTPKGEIKDEKYLDEWWEGLTIEDKEWIYKWDMKVYPKEIQSKILKDIYKLLEKKIKEERESRKRVFGG
ncbi:unnamed protein product [marine sediment metagenome]|uniref:Uncharacterized protein n=1 Tax=marine sediment metagenome TaxID=412755 RepID=X1ISR1_9ZZZZ